MACLHLLVRLPGADAPCAIEAHPESTLEQALIPLEETHGLSLADYDLALYCVGMPLKWQDLAHAVVMEELCLVPVGTPRKARPSLPGMHLLQRNEAIEFLRTRVHQSGVYLLRPSETSDVYVLSLTFEGDIRHFKIRTSLTEDGWPQHQISNRVFDSLSSLIVFYQSHPLLCGKDKSVLLKRAATEQDIASFMDSLRRPYEEIQAIAAPEDRKATVSGDLLLARKRAASRAAAAAEHSHASIQPPPAEPAPTRRSSQGAVSADDFEDSPGLDIAQRGGRIRKNVYYEWARLTVDGGGVCYEHLLTRERAATEPANFPGDVFLVQGEKTIRIPRAQAEATIRATHASKTRAGSATSLSPVCSPRSSLLRPRLSLRDPPRAAAAPAPPERPPLRREVKTLVQPPADTASVRRPPDPRVLTHAESREDGAQAEGGAPAGSRSAMPRAASEEGGLQAEPAKASAIDRRARPAEANAAKVPAVIEAAPPPPPPPAPAPAPNSLILAGSGAAVAPSSTSGCGGDEPTLALQDALATVRLKPVARRAPMLDDLYRRPTGVAAAISIAMDMRRTALQMMTTDGGDGSDGSDVESNYDEWDESDVDDDV